MDRNERGFSLIELLIVVAIIGIIAAIAIPSLLKSQQAARETAAVSEVQGIHKAQVLYSVTKGKGKYATLEELIAAANLPNSFPGGVKGGYTYTSAPVSADGLAAMYDTSAVPTSVGTFGTANVSYYMNETGVIYEAEGGEPPTATPQDRVPQNGTVYTR
ncbi:MAG TPA: prepilin-type N-terminal cleavage/methylation domain-containing protein [Blastocatellia bacterium]|jgi:prepilin-type N-terminal cleavage/methylation domain-containing protein